MSDIPAHAWGGLVSWTIGESLISLTVIETVPGLDTGEFSTALAVNWNESFPLNSACGLYEKPPSGSKLIAP